MLGRIFLEAGRILCLLSNGREKQRRSQTQVQLGLIRFESDCSSLLFALVRHSTFASASNSHKSSLARSLVRSLVRWPHSLAPIDRASSAMSRAHQTQSSSSIGLASIAFIWPPLITTLQANNNAGRQWPRIQHTHTHTLTRAHPAPSLSLEESASHSHKIALRFIEPMKQRDTNRDWSAQVSFKSLDATNPISNSNSNSKGIN